MDKALLTAMLALVRVTINQECLTDYESLQEIFSQLSPRCNPGYDSIQARTETFREAIQIVPRIITHGFFIRADGKLTANDHGWEDWFDVSSPVN